MKSLYFPLVIFFAFLAQIAMGQESSNSGDNPNCLSSICIGDLVIDSDDAVGKVLLIDLKNDNGKITYKKNGYSYHSYANPTGLSKEIQSELFPKGIAVIDEDNYAGVLIAAFQDGRNQYQRNGYNYLSVSKNLSPAVPFLGDLKNGDLVLDENDYVGTLQNVFANGKGIYKRKGYNYFSVSSKLVDEVPEFKGIKAGLDILDSDNVSGKVIATFRDGRIQYQKSFNSYTSIATNLVTTVTELDGFKTDITIIDSDNNIGKVLKVFSDGRVQYQKEFYSYTSIENLKNLSPKISEIDGLRSGTKIIDEDDNIGVVVQIFKNGLIQYKKNDYSYNSFSRKLFSAVTSLDDVFKVGTTVIDTENVIGTILQLFSNGKIQYKKENYSYNSITTKSKLSQEIFALEGVDKNKFYASEELTIGKPNRFFANKKIELKFTNNYSATTSIVTKLFPEVSDLPGIGLEDKVVAFTENKGRIKKLFSNKVILFSYIDQSFKERNLVARIYTSDEFSNEDFRRQWLNSLRYRVENSNVDDYFDFFEKRVVLENDSLDLDKLLLEDLKQKPDLIYNEKTRAKVILYLTTRLSTDPTNPPQKEIFKVFINNEKWNKSVEKVLTESGIAYVIVPIINQDDSVNTISLSIKKTFFAKSCSFNVKFDDKNSISESFSGLSNKKIKNCLSRLQTILKK